MAKVKVINTWDKPFEFQFDAEPFGPFAPGEIVELERNVAEHGIKKSWLLDAEGLPTKKRLEYLSDVQQDKDLLQSLPQVYKCPFSDRGCQAGSYKSIEDLKAHLEEAHWPKPESGEGRKGKERLGVTLRG